MTDLPELYYCRACKAIPLHYCVWNRRVLVENNLLDQDAIEPVRSILCPKYMIMTDIRPWVEP